MMGSFGSLLVMSGWLNCCVRVMQSLGSVGGNAAVKRGGWGSLCSIRDVSEELAVYERSFLIVRLLRCNGCGLGVLMVAECALYAWFVRLMELLMG